MGWDNKRRQQGWYDPRFLISCLNQHKASFLQIDYLSVPWVQLRPHLRPQETSLFSSWGALTMTSSKPQSYYICLLKALRKTSSQSQSPAEVWTKVTKPIPSCLAVSNVFQQYRQRHYCFSLYVHVACNDKTTQRPTRLSKKTWLMLIGQEI